MIDRIIKNWKSTITGLITAIVIMEGCLGFDIDPTKLATAAAGFYVILLLLVKDRPK